MIFFKKKKKRERERERELLNIKHASLFSLQLLSEIFLVLRRDERDMIKMCIGLHINTLYSSQILMKLEFSQQIFEKSSNIKFQENRSGGSRDVPCGQTDGLTNMAKLSHFS
jgi:hypothetical protein